MRLLLALTLACPTAAQIPLHALGPSSRYGERIVALNDLDGDGVSEWAMGIIDHDNLRGRVEVRRGSDGKLLFEMFGAQQKVQFGTSIATLDDLDGDGVCDLAVGVPLDRSGGPQSGAVELRSGRNGALLMRVSGAPPAENLGASVCALDDIDGDGVGDFAAGAPFSDLSNPGSNEGVVVVHSGATGARLYALKGGDPLGYFGISLEGVDDLDGDGIGELAVGAPQVGFGGRGLVQILSGRDGSLLASLSGEPNAYFGWSLESPGDVTGDGLPDLLIGSRFQGLPAGPFGAVTLIDAGTGATHWRRMGSRQERFWGSASATLPDLDGDGSRDFAVGAAGFVHLLSGESGWTIKTLRSPLVARFGESVASLGNATQPQQPNLIVGAPLGGGSLQGHVFTFALQEESLGSTYCEPEVINTLGLLGQLSAWGSLDTARDDLTLHATYLRPGAPTWLLIARTQGFFPHPGGSDGNLCLAGPLGRIKGGKVGPGGDVTIPVELTPLASSPLHVVQPGETWYFQVWYRKTGYPAGSHLTAALALTFE